MTNVTNDTLKQLGAFFPSTAIQWRAGSMTQDKTRGKALPYIDARVVQNRLDDVVGAGNWKNSYSEVIVNGKLLAVRCALAVKVEGEWVEKEDGAHLDNIETFDQAEKAIKGVYSDALKRAAVQWGIGRYLYEFDAPWVELDNGRILMVPRLPNEMLPENEHVAAPTKPVTKPAATEVKQEVKSTPAPAAEPKQEVKAEVKPEVKPEPKPEPKQEVTPEPKPEPVAQATPASTQADTAREVLAPQSTGPDDEARARADELADQAAAKQPAKQPEVKQEVKPEPAPVAAAAPAAAAQTGGDDDKLPEDITEEQRKLAEEMLTKMTKLPAHMLRGYIDGPKGKEKFTEEVRVFLLKKLAQKEPEAA
jgi:hypothetical protein